MLSVCHLRARCLSKRFRLVYKGTCLLYHALRAISLSASQTQPRPRVIPQCETKLHDMTKIDSSQNTRELMDDSVIDINTWEQALARAPSAPTEGLFLP